MGRSGEIDPTALPAWVDSAAKTYLEWGLAVVVVLIVAALVVSARHEVRRRGKR